MSSEATFPVLTGVNWNVVKTPEWTTKIQTAVSGREFRASYVTYPRWKFRLGYEVLRADATNQELQKLIGFFNRVRGSYDDFYYIDPFDYHVADCQFGVGNGSQTAFVVTRSYDSIPTPVLVNGTPTIKADGTPVSPSSITTGIQLTTINFASPPANGVVLTWTGDFHYRCRFISDLADFENFMYNLWALKKIEFISIK